MFPSHDQCTFENLDCANNGSLAPADTDVSTTHGGIYIANSSNVTFTNIYCEYNAQRFGDFYQRNNIYVHSDCIGIDITRLRDDFAGGSNVITTLFPEAMGANEHISYSNRIIEKAGAGTNFLNNPKLEYRNESDVPYFYSQNGTATLSYDATEYPEGFYGSLDIQSAAAAYSLYVPIYDSANNVYVLTDPSKYVGKTLTFSAWVYIYDVNASSVPSSVLIGVGTSTNLPGSLSYCRSVVANKWVKVVQNYTIVGTETYLACGVRLNNNSGWAKLKVAGMSCTFGSSPADFVEAATATKSLRVINDGSITVDKLFPTADVGTVKDAIIMDGIETDGANLAGGEGVALVAKLPGNTNSSYLAGKLYWERTAAGDSTAQSAFVIQTNPNTDQTETLTNGLRLEANGEVTIYDHLNIPANKGVVINATTLWTSGSGSPEGVLTANVGSLYTRTDGGASTTLYVKESGTGNTGWVAK